VHGHPLTDRPALGLVRVQQAGRGLTAYLGGELPAEV